MRDRQPVIRKPHTTTKGRSGLTTYIIIQLIKWFIISSIYTCNKQRYYSVSFQLVHDFVTPKFLSGSIEFYGVIVKLHTLWVTSYHCMAVHSPFRQTAGSKHTQTHTIHVAVIQSAARIFTLLYRQSLFLENSSFIFVQGTAILLWYAALYDRRSNVSTAPFRTLWRTQSMSKFFSGHSACVPHTEVASR